MLKQARDNVLIPILGRLGSFATGGLVAWGVQQQHADWIALGITGLGLAGVDLLTSWVRRRWIVDTTLRQTLDAIFGADAKP